MKKYKSVIASIFSLVFFVSVFVACEDDVDTPVKEPASLFFSAKIDNANKSFTIGNNGFLSRNIDTCYTDDVGDHFNTFVRFYQAQSGYYISSAEIIEFSLMNVLDSTMLPKDSLFHGRLSESQLPFYSLLTLDTARATGFQIRWRDNNKKWYSSTGLQASSVTIDSTRDLTIDGGLSSHEVYIRFDCTLYAEDSTNSSLSLKDGKARIYFFNTCFF